MTRPFVVRRIGVADGPLIAGMLLAAGLIAFACTGELGGTLVAACVASIACGAVHLALPRLTAAGVVETALAPIALVCLTPWAYFLLREQGFPDWAAASVWVGAGVGMLLLGFGFATRLVDDAMFTHRRWRRPTEAPPEDGGPGAPKVSIHVPCYAEPPEVVIQTLERLARLRYANYEVIVCDNNTPDEALWRPVQRYCQQLNAAGSTAPFRFFHVAPLRGAKAGALNFCLERTAADAELVAVIDADYLAEPDFLARMTGFFADPAVGFVQTPHDYRPDGTAYQAMCYWEYMPPNRVGLASINEYDCAYTIGTMCLFRRDAIERAGGWAEWCLTEDSEISIRIRALGYEGVYVNETFGRGLIPETYEDLKKQRFRWTAGPVQQLLAHWRLFLPTMLGGHPGLHGWVKLMEVHRSLVPVVGAFGFVAGLVATGLASWLTIRGSLPPIGLPPAFWIAGAVGAVSGLAKLWQRYRLTGCPAPTAIVGAEIARLSLGLVKMGAALAPLTGRSIAWRRTPKFAADSSVGRALASTAPELALSALFGLLLYVPLRYRDELGSHAAVLGVIACAWAALAFVSAPLMALLSETRLRAAKGAEEREPGVAEVAPAPLSRAA